MSPFPKIKFEITIILSGNMKRC